MAAESKYYGLLNPPCKVVFAGWESDTYRLGRHGWKVSLEDDPMGLVTRMMLHHPGMKMSGFAVSDGGFNTFGWRSAGMPYDRLPIFSVKQIYPDIKIAIERDAPLLPEFSDWADTRPCNLEMRSIYEHPLFIAESAPKAEELIVEPADVMQLLEQIKRMQAPEQAEIRRRREREAPTAMATILAFG